MSRTAYRWYFNSDHYERVEIADVQKIDKRAFRLPNGGWIRKETTQCAMANSLPALERIRQQWYAKRLADARERQEKMATLVQQLEQEVERVEKRALRESILTKDRYEENAQQA